MKKICSVILAFMLTIPAFAEFKTAAKSALLIDFDSGAEIVAKNADVLMPPSSMLKLMTLLIEICCCNKKGFLKVIIWDTIGFQFCLTDQFRSIKFMN